MATLGMEKMDELEKGGLLLVEEERAIGAERKSAGWKIYYYKVLHQDLDAGSAQAAGSRTLHIMLALALAVFLLLWQNDVFTCARATSRQVAGVPQYALDYGMHFLLHI